MSDTIRRGHLIYSAGVGGLTILKNGTSMICSGLEYWFRDSDGTLSSEAIKANRVSDWRLEERLRVAELRTPPGAPDDKPSWAKQTASSVGVPFQRFPLWHVCPNCRRMTHEKNTSAIGLRCEQCKGSSKFGPRLIQVPLVAACEAGHLEEFPWQEWLKNCECSSPRLTLRQAGGAGLSNFILKCETCGKHTRMQGALTDKGIKNCSGNRPWLGTSAGHDECPHKLKGVLRNSASVYYSNVASSVYIPRTGTSLPEELIELFRAPTGVMGLILSSGDEEALVSNSREHLGAALSAYSNRDVIEAINIAKSEAVVSTVAPDELDYRFSEFEVLSGSVEHDKLRVESALTNTYDFSGLPLDSISLVETLTVTKALTGFGRLVPGVAVNEARAGSQFWRNFPGNPKERWLPAIQVRGEGVFLRLDEEKLQEWENRESVQNRIARLLKDAATSRFASKDLGEIRARFILLHTFSHLLMNRMVFEAGYSATSLSERIYARPCEPGTTPMAGLLIYTASGDAEGSLGGLVRLGKPGQLEALVDEAISSARWCSSDPICMELGGGQGQGPDGLNLAACHSCVHMPETACEAFNVLMDRALVIGSLEDPTLGFFN